MGITSLQSFLTANRDSFATREQIRDTSLVVDCNNFQHYLLDQVHSKEHSHNYRADVYGGHLISYSGLVRHFFNGLTRCGITPIFVADGSSLAKTEMIYGCLDEIRHQLELAKARDNLKKVLKVSESDTNTKNQLPAAPRLFKVVFTSIAREFGFNIVQVAYEANIVITKMANDLRCPVLAGDSDFILQPLEHGFIILKNFPTSLRNGSNYLECDVYKREKLVAKFPGIDATTLPLLNVLIGKLAEEWGTFKPVIELLKQQQEKYSGTLKSNYDRHKLIVRVLDWLSKKSLDDALNFIFDNIHQDKRELAEKFAKNMLKTYNQDNYESDLASVFATIYSMPSDQCSGDQTESTEAVLTPAQYLAKMFNSSYITKSTLEIILGKTIYETESINDPSLPASSRLRFRVYSIIAALLRPESPEKLKSKDREITRGNSIDVFARNGIEYEKSEVKPMRELENYGLLDRLDCYELVRMSKEEKERILIATFRFSLSERDQLKSIVSKVFTDEPYINELIISMLLVKYISIETKQTPDREFVYAIIWSIYYYHLKEQQGVDDQAKKFMKRLGIHTAMKNRFAYPLSPSTYSRIVHLMTSLQVAYEAFYSMNGLLGGIYSQPAPDKWFNGPLIFRLAKLVKYRSDLTTWCSCNSPNLYKLCLSVYDQLDTISL